MHRQPPELIGRFHLNISTDLVSSEPFKRLSLCYLDTKLICSQTQKVNATHTKIKNKMKTHEFQFNLNINKKNIFLKKYLSIPFFIYHHIKKKKVKPHPHSFFLFLLCNSSFSSNFPLPIFIKKFKFVSQIIFLAKLY